MAFGIRPQALGPIVLRYWLACVWAVARFFMNGSYQAPGDGATVVFAMAEHHAVIWAQPFTLSARVWLVPGVGWVEADWLAMAFVSFLMDSTSVSVRFMQ